MRRALLAFLLLLSLHAARGEPLWQTLPPTPAPVPGEYTGHATAPPSDARNERRFNCSNCIRRQRG
jgi:hypothetical protein